MMIYFLGYSLFCIRWYYIILTFKNKPPTATNEIFCNKKSVVILIRICNIIHWPLLSVALPKLFSNELNFHYCKNVIVREAISFEKKKGMYIRSESKNKRIDFQTFDIDRSILVNIYFSLVLVTKYIDV